MRKKISPETDVMQGQCSLSTDVEELVERVDDVNVGDILKKTREKKKKDIKENASC